jgi:hypothetical protein
MEFGGREVTMISPENRANNNMSDDDEDDDDFEETKQD